uniref:Uncharacterized protein n=1 Tax=Palpitomonas bilix TaxID=652834 RepID=A0A7S3FZP4_9EUKA|mmetsp:Transcript_13233/g.34702  ORF Transcript_13233/g.34702 Transcript_13233/m.34702 type:complete len:576 (+) Transcript_13233:59-1786(+)
MEKKEKGDAAFKCGDYNKAISLYSEALKHIEETEKYKLFSNRSAAHTKTRNFKAALKDADQCITLKPEWTKGYYRRGVALFNTGKAAEAYGCFVNALERSPDDRDIHSFLAKIRVQLDREDILKWSKFVPRGPAHEGLFCASAVPLNKNILFFGGMSSEKTAKTVTLLDPEEKMWWNPQQNNVPSFKDYFFPTATLVGNRLFLYRTISTDEDACMLILHTDTMTWEIPAKQGYPREQRISNSTTLVGSLLLLFGGMNQECHAYNSFDVFDVNSLRWSDEPFSASGELPSPRHSHTSTLMGEWMYVIGGTNDPEHRREPRAIMDVCAFNTRERTWKGVKFSGEMPQDLVHHCAVKIDENRIAVVGGRTAKKHIGVSIFDCVLHQWYNLRAESALPGRGVGATSSFLNDKLYVYGGISNFQGGFSSHDVSVLDLRPIMKRSTAGSKNRNMVPVEVVVVDEWQGNDGNDGDEEVYSSSGGEEESGQQNDIHLVHGSVEEASRLTAGEDGLLESNSTIENLTKKKSKKKGAVEALGEAEPEDDPSLTFERLLEEEKEYQQRLKEKRKRKKEQKKKKGGE